MSKKVKSLHAIDIRQGSLQSKDVELVFTEAKG